MIKRIQKLFSDWKAERQRTHELNEQLENLGDPGFFARASAIQRQEAIEERIRACYIKFHDKHYRRLNDIQKWVHRLGCLEAHHG